MSQSNKSFKCTKIVFILYEYKLLSQILIKYKNDMSNSQNDYSQYFFVIGRCDFYLFESDGFKDL